MGQGQLKDGMYPALTTSRSEALLRAVTGFVHVSDGIKEYFHTLVFANLLTHASFGACLYLLISAQQRRSWWNPKRFVLI